MEERIKRALKTAKADYLEIRIHEGSVTNINYTGKELEAISESDSIGGCVRALVKGGWGFVAFNDIENLPDHVVAAVEQASILRNSPISLAPIPITTEYVKASVNIDPRDIPLSKKHAICQKYNNIILSSKLIQTSSVRYMDSYGFTYFANSEGGYIAQETIFCGMSLLAIAKEGANVQRAFESVGDLRGYQNVLGLEAKCEEITQRAVDLLHAESVEGGIYTVIADPLLCGVFTHEAFGHLSEADFIYENEKLLEIMQIGKRFGRDELSIIDDGTLPGEAGTNKYDNEGTPTQKIYLIKNGILTSRLHSRETAAKMGEKPTGNARALGYVNEPIIRMSNTYMEPRDWSFEKMLEDTPEGIYCKGALGGQTNMEMFTFSPAEAFRIRNGKLAERLRDVVLTGNVFETLMNIEAIGNDLKLHGGLGGCGKGGQFPLRVSDGGPHIRIRTVVVGGR
ncbi:MAG TPA: TldD/PmbA family protein [Candidatus Hypogeohydataceae bacterium YC40]